MLLLLLPASIFWTCWALTDLPACLGRDDIAMVRLCPADCLDMDGTAEVRPELPLLLLPAWTLWRPLDFTGMAACLQTDASPAIAPGPADCVGENDAG